MALGFSLILLAATCGVIVLLGVLWIIRSIRTGEFGLFSPGMGPAIRRVRQPVMFWMAITILAVLLLLPLESVIYVARQVLS
jgi:hypothetical protein